MRKKLLSLVVAAVAVLAVAGGLFWYFVLRSDAPPEVSLAGALESAATAAPVAASSPAGTAPTTGAAAQASTSGLSGTWVPDTALTTFLGYRVVEELARIGANTAVGRTSGVTGQVVIDGNTVTSATIEADLTRLKSDNNLRDGQLRNQAIETNRFPKSTFQLSEPLLLPEGLSAGQSVNAVLKGKLTLHGVTRDVAIPAQAQVKDGRLVVVGSIEIQFSDYQIARPNGASVLSIEDHGTMELQLFLKKS